MNVIESLLKEAGLPKPSREERRGRAADGGHQSLPDQLRSFLQTCRNPIQNESFLVPWTISEKLSLRRDSH